MPELTVEELAANAMNGIVEENKDTAIENKDTAGEVVVVEKTGDAKIEPKAVEPIRTPFGEFTGGQEPTAEFDKEKPFDFFQEKYKLDVKDVEGFVPHMDELMRLRAEVSVKEEELKEGNQYKALFEKLPTDLKNPMYDFLEGKEYKKPSVSGLDYSKEATSYTENELMKHYNPNFTDEDFDVDEDDAVALKAITSMKSNADKMYASERAAFLGREKEYYDNVQKNTEKLKLSITSSIQSLKTKYPTFTDAEIKTVEDKMMVGFADDLFNESGEYKAEAAIKIAMAEFGETSITTLNENLQKMLPKHVQKAVSDANEARLKATLNDKLGSAGGGGESDNSFEKQVNEGSRFSGSQSNLIHRDKK